METIKKGDGAALVGGEKGFLKKEYAALVEAYIKLKKLQMDIMMDATGNCQFQTNMAGPITDAQEGVSRAYRALLARLSAAAGRASWETPDRERALREIVELAKDDAIGQVLAQHGLMINICAVPAGVLGDASGQPNFELTA